MIITLIILLTLAICIIFGISSFVAGVNAYVMGKGDNAVITSEKPERLEDVMA